MNRQEPNEERLADAVSNYVDRLNVGHAPDIEAYLNHYAEMADELRPLLRTAASVHSAARSIRSAEHDVQWTGVFRGTDQDPRETGWCVACHREVYDGEDSAHRMAWP